MNNEQLLLALTDVDDRFIAEAAPKKRRAVRLWLQIAAACLCVAAAVILPVSLLASPGTYADPMHADVTEVSLEEIPYRAMTVRYAIEPLEEILHNDRRCIFRGVITDVRYQKIVFQSSTWCLSVLTVEVTDVVRGELAAGEEYRLLVSVPFSPSGKPLYEVGAEGVFMPIVHSDSSHIEVEGVTLHTIELAEGSITGFQDVILFTPRENGIYRRYDKNTYHNRTFETLDDAVAYIKEVLAQE